MLLSNQPTPVQVPFANSGTKNTIPVASQIGITAGAASYTDGFPPLTFTPIASGGVPPAGADFNGILNAITSVLRWQSGGGHFTYDSTWSSANSGYPKGALLLKADGSGFWFNTTDGNTVNPDTVGTNWSDFAAAFATPLASSAATQTGTSTTTAVTPKGLADTMGGSAAQSWQNKTSVRVFGTTYYNTTGHPLKVIIRPTSSSSGLTISASINGGATFTIGASQNNSGTAEAFGYIEVPIGQSYVITQIGGSGTVNTWYELI